MYPRCVLRNQIAQQMKHFLWEKKTVSSIRELPRSW